MSNTVRQEPMMVIGSMLNVAVIMLAAFYPGLHLTQAEIAAVSTISTAVTSVSAAFLVTPVNLAVVNSAVTTILVACAAFGLHLQSADIALVAGSITSLLSYLMREKVTAVANLRRPMSAKGSFHVGDQLPGWVSS